MAQFCPLPLKADHHGRLELGPTMSVAQPIASTNSPVHENIAGPSQEDRPSVSNSTAPATTVPVAEGPGREQAQKVTSVEWGLKPIHWPPEQPNRVLRIITQNENGPCSFIAICASRISKVHYNLLMQHQVISSYSVARSSSCLQIVPL